MPDIRRYTDSSNADDYAAAAYAAGTVAYAADAVYDDVKANAATDNSNVFDAAAYAAYAADAADAAYADADAKQIKINIVEYGLQLLGAK